MEEQNNKEVKLHPTKNKETNKKLSYEKLNEMANQLFNENRYLKLQLQKATEFINTIDKLNYLFRVVEIDHNNRSNNVSFDQSFVEECISNIQKMLSMPEENTTKKEEN